MEVSEISDSFYYLVIQAVSLHIGLFGWIHYFFFTKRR